MLLNYRKDIDGLRAIAVLLVVLFHMGLPIIGGFVGVDIFFVISGFLIASLIQKQILRGKFTFKGFYLHRIRRISPALLFVILGTFVLAWFTLLFNDFVFFTKSIVYTIFGLSNIYFYSKGQDYFSIASDKITLLHTWSLGVEEQFYFIAPLFLIILFKYFYKTKYFNYILISFILLGLGISQYYAMNNQAAAYYLLPSRFFELLMGVFLALNLTKIPVSKNNLFNNVLSVLALLFMFIPAFVLTKEDLFPGISAFIVCLGACLVIYLGHLKKSTFLTKIISTKPFVFVGLISYSLYLWHWPIISIINTVKIQLTLLNQLSLIALFIVLAYLTWKFIEQPFRNKFKMNFLWTFVAFVFVPLLFWQVVKAGSSHTDGFTEVRLSKKLPEIYKNLPINSAEKKKYCHAEHYQYFKEQENCIIGDSKAEVDTLYFGDSHANALARFVELLLEDASLKSKILTASSTVYFKGYNQDLLGLEGDNISYDDALEYMQAINQEINSAKYNNIILTGYFAKILVRYDENKLQEMFFDTIKQIKDANPKANIYILKDVPFIGNQSKYCDLYNKILGLNSNCLVSIKDDDTMPKSIDNIFDEIQKKYPNITFIDIKDAWCENNSCKLLVDNTLMYLDNHHLSYLGTELLAKIYLERFANPIKNN